MDSKQYILENLKKNTREVYPRPEIKINRTTYPDRMARFKEIMAAVGGLATELEPGESIDQAIRRLFPEAKTIASNLPEVTCATLNPDTVASPTELNGTDLCVFRGEFGVCENAAVYYEQAFKQRAIYFISEAIVILLDKQALVDTMHDAYARVPKEFHGEFRGFISGPSKTADIEQALVMGAHGARNAVVLFV